MWSKFEVQYKVLGIATCDHAVISTSKETDSFYYDFNVALKTCLK